MYVTQIIYSSRQKYIAAFMVFIIIAFLLIHQGNNALVVDFQVSGSVRQVAISSSSKYVAAIDDGNTLSWWRLPERKIVRQISFQTADLFDVRFTPNENALVVGGNDGFIRVFDIETAEIVFAEQVLFSDVAEVVYKILPDGSSYPRTGGVFSLAFTHDGRSLVVGGVNGQLAILSTSPWKVLATSHIEKPFDITHVAIDHTDRYIAVNGMDGSGSIAIWDLMHARQVAGISLDRLYNRLEVTHFRETDGTLIVGGFPRFIAILAIEGDHVNPSVQATFDARNFSSLAISDNGHLFVRGGFVATGDYFLDGFPLIGNGDNTAYIHVLPTYQELTQIHKEGLCWREDPQNATLTLPIPCPMLKPIQVLRGHMAKITAIAINHQNTLVVTGSEDKHVKVWKIAEYHL